MKKALATLLLAGSAQARNANDSIVIIEDPLVLGIFNRETLILLILAILALYVIIRLLAIRRKRKREEDEAEALEYDKADQLRAEKAKLERMIEAARKSYYKRELSEAEAKRLMFEYRQRIIEIDEELKVL